MVDLPRSRMTVSTEKYEAVRQQVSKLEIDALLMESSYKDEVSTLEKSLLETQNTAKWLRVRVTELEEQLAAQKAENLELRRAGGSSSNRKYDHALKVIQDLLAAKEWTTEIDPALLQDILREASEAPGSSRGNRQHDRANTTGTSSSHGTTTRPLPSPAPSFDAGRQGGSTPPNSSLFRRDVSISSPPREMTVPSDIEDMYEDEQGSGNEGGGSSTAMLGTFPAPVAQRAYRSSEQFSSPTTVASSEIILRHSYHQGTRSWVYWNAPPGCAIYALGPYTWEELRSKMNMEDPEISKQEDIERLSRLGLPYQVQTLGDNGENVVFLHRPMFYDAGEKTYLVSWAEDHVHDVNMNYLRQWTHRVATEPDSTGRRPLLHVMSYPEQDDESGPKGWWYFCAMKWKVVSISSIWDILDSSKKAALVDQIVKRRDTLDRNRVPTMIANGELKQLTIEMTSASKQYASTFAQGILGVTSSELQEAA